MHIDTYRQILPKVSDTVEEKIGEHKITITIFYSCIGSSQINDNEVHVEKLKVENGFNSNLQFFYIEIFRRRLSSLTMQCSVEEKFGEQNFRVISEMRVKMLYYNAKNHKKLQRKFDENADTHSAKI